MIKRVLLNSLLLLALGAMQTCQARIFSWRLVLNSTMSQSMFTWRGRTISWIDQGDSLEKTEIIDLSDCKGPFVVENAKGDIEVREGTLPRLAIQKKLHAKSMDTVETVITKNDSGTTISTELKSDVIEGAYVNYILFLPKSEKVDMLSTICGSIVVKFQGILKSAHTSNGSIKVDGVSSPVANVMDLKTSNGKINAENIKGDLRAESSNGRIDLDTIEGAVSAKTSNGSIDAKNIGGNVMAESSNGRIELATIAGTVWARTSNGNVYCDGKRIN